MFNSFIPYLKIFIHLDRTTTTTTERPIYTTKLPPLIDYVTMQTNVVTNFQITTQPSVVKVHETTTETVIQTSIAGIFTHFALYFAFHS